MFILLIGLGLLITFTIYEYALHQKRRSKIPNIIHINGTRGKSSVTRLIAAGLREGGIKTIAKTTGSAPRIILEDGSEIPIKRYFGANIKEQIKIIKFASKKNIDVLVLECMAITPEYQWVTEHKMMNSEIGVLTNIRMDHIDLMGPGIKNIARSICNTIPKNSITFTCEKKYYSIIKKTAEKEKTKVYLAEANEISDKDMKNFPYIAHKENIAVSLKVCEHFGIKREIALQGMRQVRPDIGAAKLFNININNNKTIFFAHTFAANDPESTKAVIEHITVIHPHIDFTGFVLNTRADRIFRSKQLIKMLTQLSFDKLYLIGEKTSIIRSYALKNNIRLNNIVRLGWIGGNEFLNEIKKINKEEILLIGIGNIGGNGKIIIDYFKNMK